MRILLLLSVQWRSFLGYWTDADAEFPQAGPTRLYVFFTRAGTLLELVLH
jgi:hypothetical protein